MNIGWSTGFGQLGNYWGDWFTSKQIGGSERIVVQVSEALAAQGHSVTVRLPYDSDERVRRGVRYIGSGAASQRYEVLLCADDYWRRDHGLRTALVACRSDRPVHTNFDELIFLSKHHATLMGHPDRPYVGGGVDLADYAQRKKRIPRRVICTSSPDRCPGAVQIGRPFDFRQSYKPVMGMGEEMSRADLIDLQQTAMVHVYPLDPRRPSDFFSMSVLESMAAGTPVIVSDADSMPELWGDTALVLPRPIDYLAWYEAVERLLTDRAEWKRLSERGRRKAEVFTWDKQAQRYLALALA